MIFSDGSKKKSFANPRCSPRYDRIIIFDWIVKKVFFIFMKFNDIFIWNFWIYIMRYITFLWQTIKSEWDLINLGRFLLHFYAIAIFALLIIFLIFYSKFCLNRFLCWFLEGKGVFMMILYPVSWFLVRPLILDFNRKSRWKSLLNSRHSHLDTNNIFTESISINILTTFNISIQMSTLYVVYQRKT